MNWKLFGGVTLIAVALAFSALSNIQAKPESVPLSMVEMFQQWRSKHSKLYSTPAESDFRLRVFFKQANAVQEYNAKYEENLKAHNLPPVTAPMFEINDSSDLTTEEFTATRTGDIPSHVHEYHEFVPTPVDPNKNLRQTAYENRVRNQGKCGSCWSFSNTAVTEKFYFDTYGQQIDFSQQYNVDCDIGQNGCNGGNTYGSLVWIKNNGVVRASEYPYTESQTECKGLDTVIPFGPEMTPKIFPFTLAAADNLLKKGVVISISIYASGGIRFAAKNTDPLYALMTGECMNGTNHAVVLSGRGEGYVRLQNSWSSSWGDQGFKNIVPCDPNKTLIGGGTVIRHAYTKY